MEAHWSKHRLIARAVFFSAQGRMLGQGMEAQAPEDPSLSSMWGEALKVLGDNLKEATEAGAEESGKAALMLDKQLIKLLANTIVKTEAMSAPAEISELPEPVQKHVNDLKDVIASGGAMKRKGAVESKFHRAIQRDPLLKAQKDECKGKGNLVLAEFKTKWAQGDLSQIMQKHIKTEEVIDLEKLDAEFVTIDRMWSREGGTPAALETCQVFTESALASYEKGELFHGHQYLKYDKMRKRMMVRWVRWAMWEGGL